MASRNNRRSDAELLTISGGGFGTPNQRLAAREELRSRGYDDATQRRIIYDTNQSLAATGERFTGSSGRFATAVAGMLPSPRNAASPSGSGTGNS